MNYIYFLFIAQITINFVFKNHLSPIFATCTNITSISCHTPPPQPARLDILFNLFQSNPNLITVSINYADINDEALIFLVPSMPNLTSIDLSYTSISDASIPFLLNFCPKLTSIIVKYTAISDAAMTTFGKFASLQHLDIRGNPISDQGINSLISELNSKNLQWFDMSKTNISNTGLLKLFKHCINLTTIGIENSLVTYEGLQSLMDDPQDFALQTILSNQ